MLQFHLTRLFGTHFKTHGVALPKAEGLQLVFREGEAAGPNLFDKEIQSVLIHWDNLDTMEIARGFFSTTLTLSILSPERISELPGLNESQLELKIHRSNLDQIEPFERAVKSYRSGAVDENVDEFIDDVRDFLDRRPDFGPSAE